MKKLQILTRVLKQTKASQILLSFLGFVAAVALVIWIFDPAVPTLGDALWYCCVVISTVGFGDLAATTLITRIATVLLMIYSIFVIAIVTGVIVNFYSQVIAVRQQEETDRFLLQLERLPELSKEELEALAAQAKALRKNGGFPGH